MDLSKPSSATPSYTSGVCLPGVSPNSSTAIPLYPAVKCESPSFDFAYYGHGSSPYGGFHPMMQYHPSVKSEMSRMGCDTPDLIDAKSNNVSKDPAPIPEGMLISNLLLCSLYYAEACNEFAGFFFTPLRPGNTAFFKELSQWWRAFGNTVFD